MPMPLHQICRFLYGQNCESILDLLLLSYLAGIGVNGTTTQRIAETTFLPEKTVLPHLHRLHTAGLIHQSRDTGKGRPLRHTITGKAHDLLLQQRAHLIEPTAKPLKLRNAEVCQPEGAKKS
jgi:DNA-binding IclR family transcriptional regulator